MRRPQGLHQRHAEDGGEDDGDEAVGDGGGDLGHHQGPALDRLGEALQEHSVIEIRLDGVDRHIAQRRAGRRRDLCAVLLPGVFEQEVEHQSGDESVHPLGEQGELSSAMKPEEMIKILTAKPSEDGEASAEEDDTATQDDGNGKESESVDGAGEPEASGEEGNGGDAQPEGGTEGGQE